MKVSDKALGYASFAVLLCILAGVAFGMYRAHRETATRAFIDFDELGSLSPEDPMTENGYEIGHVGSVEWLGDRSRVTVIFDVPVVLREGTRFRNAAFALMGGRRIELIRSKTGDALPESHVFKGEFVPGITESLRHIVEIRDRLMTVKDASMLILSGSKSNPGVVQKYEEAMESVEALLSHLDGISRAANGKIQKALNTADSASGEIVRIAEATDETFRTASGKAEEAIGTAASSLQSLSDGIGKVERILSAVESDSLAQNLLETADLVEALDSLAGKMSQLVQSIQTKGMAVYDENGNRVRLTSWKNWNIIGKTAREKAREKQKKSSSTP